MGTSKLFWRCGILTHSIALVFLTSSLASALSVTVTIENLSPSNGIFLTPAWVGFHDGGFDLYDNGVSLNPGFPGMENLVEDGNTGPLSTRFDGDPSGVVQGTIPGLGGAFAGPIDPGESAMATFLLDNTATTSQYFSYASMVIPSNDAFIANGNPLAHQIFDGAGNFLGADFIVLGSSVLDGGTEDNDELPANTAFLGQATLNTGVDENGVVQFHPGFIPGGNILTAFPNADFTAPNFQVARITVSAVPEPSTFLLFGSGLMGVAMWRFRSKKKS